MKMKSTFVVIAALLFAALLSQTHGQLGANRPTECCFSHVRRQIPEKYLNHYTETRSDCSMPGLIFVLKGGIKICANPNHRWVKDRIQFLDEQFMNNKMKTQEKK
ncbi:C-C motif chemokine 3-like [Acipenser oxyrinchus oxyrinchus]|uniref:C-C motif chemokine n=1 Tax=Acipenser oxyrinchus oxyrinchus TaxID=40147 RepID=A0AAD8GJV0_ACIOX|nr:C-C motif chemokine 3-like [Acipenser oxyrinchus oxyrinchus]